MGNTYKKEGLYTNAQKEIMKFREYRKQAIHAAIELGYGAIVVSAVRESNSIAEIERIMSTARRAMK